MDFSILSLLAQATLVAKAILVLLLFMSIASWALMCRKWLNIREGLAKTVDGMDRFNRAKDLREAVQSLGGDPDSPLYTVAHEGVTEFNRSKEAGTTEEVVVDNVRRSLRQGVDMEMTRLTSSLSFLATAANTAPFIGLFGTVWGIMNTFHAIGAMKSASLATVAPGISEALIATAMGLAVAIPATVGYNTFHGRLGVLETKMVNFAGMFLNRVQRELNAHRPVSRTGQSE
ncbi:MAG: protein TolQ [Bilophila sp.]